MSCTKLIGGGGERPGGGRFQKSFSRTDP